MSQIVGKVPFQVNGDALEVWVVRDAIEWEFSAHVRKDSSQVQFVWPDSSLTQNRYYVSFETEMDAQTVMGLSAVTHVIAAARNDAFRMKYQKCQ